MLVSACEPGPADAPVGIVSASVLSKVPNEAIGMIGRGEEFDLLLALEDGPIQVSLGLAEPPGTPLDVGVLADRLRTRSAAFSALKSGVLSAAADGEYEIKRSYQNLPLLFLRIKTLRALSAIAERDEALHFYANEKYQLLDSLTQIDQPFVVTAGKLGADTTVAVLDTGTDYTNAAFGSCESAGAPGCKVVFAQDFAPDDGSLDDNGHGTNVAGIVVGVAPAARIAALDVFDGTSAASADIASAIDWVIAHKTEYNIVAINLSLGGTSYSAACADDALALPVANAKSAGVLSAIAAGNDGYTNKISSPGCVPAAVSVGATYSDTNAGQVFSYPGANNCNDTVTADKVACFSNSAPFLTLLAPGGFVTAAGITDTGTSQATPQVSGAIAVLRAAFPTETLDQIVKRMTATGKPITDSRNGLVKARLDLKAAVGDCAEGCGVNAGCSSDEVPVCRCKAGFVGDGIDCSPIEASVTGEALRANGDFAVQFVGTPDVSYRIFASADLTEWSAMVDETADASGRFSFVDTTNAGVAIRFYSAKPTTEVVTQVSVGEAHACVLTAARGVKCWGDNALGQLGVNAVTEPKTALTFAQGLDHGVTRVHTVGNGVCATLTTGGAQCWGENVSNKWLSGPLGSGPSMLAMPTTLTMNGFSTNYWDAQPGCIVTSVGGIKCWGRINDGDSMSSGAAAVVHDYDAADHHCALSQTGMVSCWGDNAVGELGNNNPAVATSASPIVVSGLTAGVAAIVAGDQFSCALTSAAGVKCWGAAGGNGTATNRFVATDVVGLTSGVSAISSAGADHACAITGEGGGSCWGGSYGALPIAVTGIPADVVAIDAGNFVDCAITGTGDLFCWNFSENLAPARISLR